MWSRRTMHRMGTTAAVAAALLTTVGQLTDGETHPRGTGQPVAMDVFSATAHEVARLRQEGAEPRCRLRAGVWEPERPDAHRFPPTALGAPVGPDSGQRWLDIRAWEKLAPVMTSRLLLCREKGFETVTLTAVHPFPGGTGAGAAATEGPGYGDRPTAADWMRFRNRLVRLAGDLQLAVR